MKRSRRMGRQIIWSLFALGLVATNASTSAQQPAQPVVALAYDAASNVILKALPDAVLRSSDDGISWEQVGSGVGGGPITALATAAGSGELYVAGPSIGVLRLADSGWISANGDLPSKDVTALAAHADQPGTLYAYVPASGIYRSRDEGVSWQLMDRGPPDIRFLVHSNMAGSMETGWLYAIAGDALHVSMDCFCLWRALAVDLPPPTALAYDPSTPSRVLAASSAGLFESQNGGQDWVLVAPPVAEVTALMVTAAGELLAGTANGTVLRSLDGGLTWEGPHA